MKRGITFKDLKTKFSSYKTTKEYNNLENFISKRDIITLDLSLFKLKPDIITVNL
jgi:hypothetical protein